MYILWYCIIYYASYIVYCIVYIYIYTLYFLYQICKYAHIYIYISKMWYSVFYVIYCSSHLFICGCCSSIVRSRYISVGADMLGAPCQLLDILIRRWSARAVVHRWTVQDSLSPPITNSRLLVFLSNYGHDMIRYII